MATIPIAERKVGPQSVRVGTPNVGSSVPGAFGEDVAKAQAELGVAGVKTGATLIENMNRIATHRNKWQNDAKVASLTSAYFSGTLDMLHNDRTRTVNRDGKDYDIEDGILDRPGYNAVGSTNEFIEKEYKLRQEFLNQVADPQYKAALEQKLMTHFLNLKEAVIIHEASQHRAADTEAYKSLNKNLIDSASMSPEPGILAGIIANLGDNNAKLADRLGLDEATQKLNTNIDVAKAVENAVMTSLKSTGSLDIAKSLLDSTKENITEKDYRDLSDQLESYSRQKEQELRVQKSILQNANGSKTLDIWSNELEKPLDERTITPQFLKDEHRAGNIDDSLFTSLLNNILGKEEARVKAEEIKAKNTEQAQMLTLLRKRQLTEDIINAAADREKDPLDAGFALQMTNAVQAQAKKGAEPTPLESITKFNELVERNADIAKREKAWFGFGKVPFEEITKFRADVIDANTKKYLTDTQMKDLLSETSQTFYRDPVFQNALKQLATQSKLYATPEMQARTKAEMYGSLIGKVISGKNPREAVDEVIREKISSEVEEAVKNDEIKDKRITTIIEDLRKKNMPDAEIAKFMREKGLDPEIYGVKE